MTDREIMQKALDALEYHTMQTRPISHTDKAIEALHQALAQPEQEHIECGYDETVGMCTNNPCCEQAQPEQEFKYTPYGLRSDENGKLSIGEISQREWVELTDDERNEMIGRIQHDQYTRQRDLINKTQIITEMYLKDKNT